MNSYPRLVVDLSKLEHNTRTIVDLAGSIGIEITGVTKASCGDPKVANSMLRGGAASLGESRLQNIRNLKSHGIECPIMLLRTPMLSEVEDVVRYADISLNSEARVIKALSRKASGMNTTHKVVPMVEMGDLREGIVKDAVPQMIDLVLGLDCLELHGLGMNLACFGGVVPTIDKVREFEDLVERMEDRFGLELGMISGGNSANIPLLLSGPERGRTNNLRIGEGILLGLETVNRTPIPGTHQDSFVLEAEVIERKRKPSVPDGTISQNAYGETPEFEDRGEMIRGIAAVGRQDTIIEDLAPVKDGIEILGGSSDHLLLDLPEDGPDVSDAIQFIPSYGALVHLYTSPYVAKVYRE
ncbi:MAG: alanine/ornithine racemase family PLP-dependent enzyme [Thermoplasmatota archaeon]